MSDSTSAPQVTDKDGYVRGHKSESLELWHFAGVQWFDAPLPWRFHICFPWTFGYEGWFTRTDRCACGAIKDGRDRRWSRKNERRRG